MEHGSETKVDYFEKSFLTEFKSNDTLSSLLDMAQIIISQ